MYMKKNLIFLNFASKMRGFESKERKKMEYVNNNPLFPTLMRQQ